jgi:hypothetical protein
MPIAPAIIQVPKPDKLVRTVKAKVEFLGWTKNGQLISITHGTVSEFPSGRSRPLRRSFVGTFDPNYRNSTNLRLNASRTRVTGGGFVLDLRTLVSTPLPRPALWVGDRLIQLGSTSYGKYRILNHKPPIPLAPGWFVLGLSPDLQLALACRKEPFDGDRTYLLRISPKTGRASVLSSYPMASDDHNWLCLPQRGGPKGQVVVHSINLAGDLATPYLAAAKLHPLRWPIAKSATVTTSTVEWIDRTTPWTIARQTLLFDRPTDPTYVDTLDLWNSKTGALEPTKSAPRLGPVSMDWPHRRIAYTVVTPQGTRIFIHPLSRHRFR